MPELEKNKHPIDVHIGKKIREARKEKHLSQEQVGDVLGVSFQQIQRYETGANRIYTSNLWEIAKFLKKPIRFFVSAENLETDVSHNRRKEDQ